MQALVGKMLQRVWDKGDIYKDQYSGVCCWPAGAACLLTCWHEGYRSHPSATSAPAHASCMSWRCLPWADKPVCCFWVAGWYCVGCEEYKTEDDMETNHICPAHQKPCEHREEENYFFRLTAYRRELQVQGKAEYHSCLCCLFYLLSCSAPLKQGVHSTG